MIPLFCQGRAVERPTSQAVGMGAKQIPTDDATSYFSAGERVFISEADGSEVEYLGTIASVATNSVTVELATEAAKSEGAKLWTPEAMFEWPMQTGTARPPAGGRVRHGGVEVVRSLGGEAYATRLGSAYVTESVRFENLTDERFGQLSSWLEQEADGGLEEFTYVDGSRVVRRVRLDVPAFEWTRRTAGDLIVAGFNLHFLAEATYV